MKHLYASLIAGLLAYSWMFGQNQAPVVTNMAVMLDTVAHTATITFDLADAENDLMDVWLRVSNDSGMVWQVPVDSVTGDVGFPISAGTSKSVTWHYDLNQLALALGNGTQQLTFRITADDRLQPDIPAMLAQVDSARMMNNLLFFQGIRHRSAGPAHHLVVHDSLERLQAALGIQNWNYSFTAASLPGQNIIGRKYGLDDDAKTWYVTAHYDSEINTPGVDDNASGTAAVLEAMAICTGYEFRHSLRFIGFDLEEDGLLGSFNYVQSRVEDWEEIEGVLNMEMIGYYDDTPNSQTVPVGFGLFFPTAYAQVQADSFRGNFLTNVANTDSEWLMHAFDSLAALYVPALRVVSLSAPNNGILTPDLRRSDHASFWDGGHPALMLTDGANMRNHNYHQPTDSIGTIHPTFFHQSAKAVIASLLVHAQPIHAGSGISGEYGLFVPVSNIQSQKPQITISPNPNNGSCVVQVTTFEHGDLAVNVFDMQGKRVARLHDGETGNGTHRFTWNANGLPNGTYFVEVSQNGKTLSKKSILRR